MIIKNGRDSVVGPLREREVPFIRHFPASEPKVQKITVSEAIAMMADEFIAAGGRYQIAVHSAAEVELVAHVPRPKGADPLAGKDLITAATVKTSNGPALPHAVDELIMKSYEWMMNIDKIAANPPVSGTMH